MKATLPEIDLEKCTGCGSCVVRCPVGAVKMKNFKVTPVWGKACSYCTECEAICPTGAIKCPFEIVLVKEDARKKR